MPPTPRSFPRFAHGLLAALGCWRNEPADGIGNEGKGGRPEPSLLLLLLLLAPPPREDAESMSRKGLRGAMGLEFAPCADVAADDEPHGFGMAVPAAPSSTI